MRRLSLWSIVPVLILIVSACSPDALDDDEPTQTPLIITATPPPATSTPAATANTQPSPTSAATSTAEPSPTPTSTAEPTATTSLATTPTAPAATATSSEPVDEALTILQSGFGQVAPGEVIGWGFVIENTDPEFGYEDLEYRLIFYDDAGTVIDTEESSVPLVLPGQRTGFAGSLFVDTEAAVASMEVEIVPGNATTVEVAEGFTVEAPNYFTDEFFPRATGLVNNPLESIVTDLRVSAIAFDAAGNITGGGFTFLSAAAPAGQTGVDVSVDGSGDVATVELFASLSYLSEALEPNPETDPIVTQFGFGADQGGSNIGWGAILENPNAALHVRDSEVVVWFQDAEGRVLDAASTFVDILPAGSTIGVADDFVFLPEGVTATTMSILVRPGALEQSELTGWFTTAEAAYVEDEFFPEVTGVVNNPFPQDFGELYVTAIAYNEAGDIIGGGFTFLDLALANASTQVTVGVMTSGVPARVELYAYPSSLTEF